MNKRGNTKIYERVATESPFFKYKMKYDTENKKSLNHAVEGSSERGIRTLFISL